MAKQKDEIAQMLTDFKRSVTYSRKPEQLIEAIALFYKRLKVLKGTVIHTMYAFEMRSLLAQKKYVLEEMIRAIDKYSPKKPQEIKAKKRADNYNLN